MNDYSALELKSAGSLYFQPEQQRTQSVCQTQQMKLFFELCGLFITETSLRETVCHSKETRRHSESVSAVSRDTKWFIILFDGMREKQTPRKE